MQLLAMKEVQIILTHPETLQQFKEIKVGSRWDIYIYTVKRGDFDMRGVFGKKGILFLPYVSPIFFGGTYHY